MEPRAPDGSAGGRVNQIPTRWRTTFEDQLEDATRRVEVAKTHLEKKEGGRALHAAYPAVVAAATVRVWIDDPPWVRPLPVADLQRRTREAFPGLFAAIASLDLKDVLNSPWQPEAVRPYVEEARSFVQETRQRLDAWLGQT
jgi:hypothetical protein